MFQEFLHRIVRSGTLTIVDAAGRARSFGPGGEPAVRIRLRDRVTPWRLWWHPQLALGECYMDGSLVIEEGTLDDLLRMCASDEAALERGLVARARRALGSLARFVQQYNPIPRAQKNVAHHYDLSRRLYELFLDQDLQYSCAYFRHGGESLERAQQLKKAHIAAKLLLKPGMRVLDIGCGFGGLALYLAQAARVEVTGLTLSREQAEVARARAAAARLGHSVKTELKDYRQAAGTFDRIVSVGMFEHVGVAHYDTFFTKVRELLAPDGVALIHAIGRTDVPGTTNAWIRKYIFPGGYCPALSETLAAVERSGLWVTDIEILRLHYAETLRNWSERFRAHRAEIAALYDERFCRMWEFYLAVSEHAFRYGTHYVFQLQLARRRDAVPLTRDYLSEEERKWLQHAA
jgi:cyclopropane-fatty-acyl-phospholipid synthase